MTRPDTWLTTGGDRVHIYRDDAGEWRWQVRAGNGEIVGSGEGHPSRGDAVAAAERHHPEVPSNR
jgi:uncharacterized protein YegP (UPF0339 family)